MSLLELNKQCLNTRCQAVNKILIRDFENTTETFSCHSCGNNVRPAALDYSEVELAKINTVESIRIAKYVERIYKLLLFMILVPIVSGLLWGVFYLA